MNAIKEYKTNLNNEKLDDRDYMEVDELLDMDQRNLSQIENPKRPVGKVLAKVFNIHYQVFLSD